MAKHFVKSRIFGLGMSLLLCSSQALAMADAQTIQSYVSRNVTVPLIKPSWGDFILHSATLNKLYQQRSYAPIWVTSEGRPHALSLRLKEKLQKASEHGLSDKDYWDESLEERFQAAVKNPRNWITYELAASEALIRYADHLSNGRFDPDQIDSDIKFKKRDFNDYQFLNTIVNSGESFLSVGLDRLAPRHTRYTDLRQALADLRAQRTQGGWATINSPGFALKLGVNDPVVMKLRERFNQLGYRVSYNGGNLFDQEFDQVVRRYQSLNGLATDGVIGTRSEVLRSVNASLQQRISQVEVNMERLRWLPRDIESRHVFINLATSEFQAFENGAKPFDFKTVVGQPFRRTPSMRDTITFVNLNPFWTIPRSITIKDKLPVLKQDYRYLERHNMVLISEATDREVDPATVNWAQMSPQNFPYYIRQLPGPDNALGVVKFPLQNPWAIYLHDTNEKNLFQEGKRHRSSGCIRLEEPLEFAAYLLADQQGWSLSQIQNFVPMSVGQRAGQLDKRVTLKRAMPVYMMYLTVEKSSDGVLRFVEDVYGQDTRVSKAIQNKKVNNELF